MAHRPLALQRYKETHTANGYISWYKYATNHTKAEMLTAAYFNDSVNTLRVGDIIEAIADADGTPELVIARVTVAAVGDDVETADLTPAAA
ncbi:hypothetical protein FIV06_15770 [Labrenzia sp. THAF191b]|uniref:hypothetical protein n=1 Tax=unclassified Labrenzia TaxID=2648686 RepID=UPI001268DDF4|nr:MULTISPECIES: hypothetical protein [unclassified Labrenzia]QFS98886.1 hypothetical protein FIV06_15770 [Labrenzia sp. THAF191b]QFT05200.1 hypothetical protein FIV05_15765 [Labrenzia sp. THAF191a]QFT16744.1 hypothetical protein FIV03_15780 [Labrenzia sp. THAF187b]